MAVENLTCPNRHDPIAVVDDSAIDLVLIKRVYERSKLPNPLIVFEGGNSFLDYMEGVKHGHNTQPALVLLDINMPDVNGFETLYKLRQQSEFKDIPTIIMLTNSDSREDENKSLELGADGFQTKPSDPHDFIAFFNSFAAKGASS